MRGGLVRQPGAVPPHSTELAAQSAWVHPRRLTHHPKILLVVKQVLLGSSTEAQSRAVPVRSEEHTSELQSRQYLVCRLLLEKRKKTAGSVRGSHDGCRAALRAEEA